MKVDSYIFVVVYFHVINFIDFIWYCLFSPLFVTCLRFMNYKCKVSLFISYKSTKYFA